MITVDYILRSFQSEQWLERVFGASAPNYIQWAHDGSKIVKSGSITANGITFSQLIPNYDGVCTFDLSVFGRQALQDIEDGDALGYTAPFRIEPDLLAGVRPTVGLQYTDNTSETLELEQLYFIRAYRQVKNKDKASFWREGVTSLQKSADVTGRVLLPTDNIARWPGFPLDVGLFFFENRGTGGEPYFIVIGTEEEQIPTDLDVGVISVNLTDIADDAIEVNTAAQISDSVVRRPLRVVQKGVSDGVYLRWLNDVGGWSYWLFEAKKLVADEYSGGGQVQVFTANPFVNETFKPLPKDRRTRWEIGTGALQAWETRHLESLADSRNVYLYTGECGDVAECCDYRVEGIALNAPCVLVSMPENWSIDINFQNWENFTIISGGEDAVISLDADGLEGLSTQVGDIQTITRGDLVAYIIANYNANSSPFWEWLIVETEEGFSMCLVSSSDNLPGGFIFFGSQASAFMITGGRSVTINTLTPDTNIEFDVTLENIYSFQILINNSWTTIDPEEIVDGVWERTTCDLITAWRIVDEGINVIDSGTFDCIPETGEDRWLPVEVVGYNLTPRKDSNVKAVRATIQLPDRYTAQV
jgi:hypothetical protein